MTTTGRSDVGTGARRQKHNLLMRTKPLRTPPETAFDNSPSRVQALDR
jgi:hypothetical protein